MGGATGAEIWGADSAAPIGRPTRAIPGFSAASRGRTTWIGMSPRGLPRRSSESRLIWSSPRSAELSWRHRRHVRIVPGASQDLGAHSTLPPRDGAYMCAVCRSEEHTSELQSHVNIVCRILHETQNI